MKYIKSFEDVNFNIGDIVICVDNSEYEYSLTLNKIYVVENLDDIFIYVKNDKNIKDSNFKKYRFRTPTPEEIEQYKLTLVVKKYNL